MGFSIGEIWGNADSVGSEVEPEDFAFFAFSQVTLCAHLQTYFELQGLKVYFNCNSCSEGLSSHESLLIWTYCLLI